MMNDLLRDIIEAEDILVSIDDVMVGTKIEEEHDDIVEEVLERMTENNLFIKLEKYVWKVREVGFLRVIIRSDRVKMEKEKIHEVVDCPVPRSLKDR